MIFDNLNYGDHFAIDGRTDEVGYVKLNVAETWNETIPTFLNLGGCRVHFNTVSYSGEMQYVHFNVPVTPLPIPTLDFTKVSDIILPDSNTISQSTNNENTNTTMSTTATALTLRDAVLDSVDTLKSSGKFSAYDVTSNIRNTVNHGAYTLPGHENPNPHDNYKFIVNHNDVKEIIDSLTSDGTLAGLGLTDIDYSGPYRKFVFDTPVSATATVIAASPTPAAPTNTSAAANTDRNVRIQAYVDVHSPVTLKQIQSTLKEDGLTCEQLNDIVEGLGYTVSPGTDGCYSTYTVL
jgi:hypothetical protein